MRVFQLIPEWFINTKVFGITMRVWFPILIVVLLIGGLFSPLFDLHHIHGITSSTLYFQHFYLDSVAGLGGWYASSYCKHLWHRIVIMLFIDASVTFLLVTLVG